jgi:sulfite reductase alpha subunit-like flavoprotein
LFFGCRRRDGDYIYREEIERYEREGVLTKVHLALSREEGQEKQYV